MLEREMHEQRQSLLSEIEKIRVREEALHKQEQVIQEIVSSAVFKNQSTLLRVSIFSKQIFD